MQIYVLKAGDKIPVSPGVGETASAFVQRLASIHGSGAVMIDGKTATEYLARAVPTAEVAPPSAPLRRRKPAAKK